VAGKLPLLSVGSNHHTTSPATSSTHSLPPDVVGGPDGWRRRHQPRPRAHPLFPAWATSPAQDGPAVGRFGR
jgi:hypothetical protein